MKNYHVSVVKNGVQIESTTAVFKDHKEVEKQFRRTHKKELPFTIKITGDEEKTIHCQK